VHARREPTRSSAPRSPRANQPSSNCREVGTRQVLDATRTESAVLPHRSVPRPVTSEAIAQRDVAAKVCRRAANRRESASSDAARGIDVARRLGFSLDTVRRSGSGG